MAEVIEPPLWQAVGLVIDQNQRDFLAGRYSLMEDFLKWFKAVDLFRQTQDERMILREPTSEDLRQHRTWVASLIAEGERLITEALTREELPDSTAGFKLPDAQATIEILYLAQREWHGPRMSEARRREILNAVFNVEEPAA
jgi:hypothetical protein